MEAGPGESRGEARIGAYEQNRRKKREGRGKKRKNINETREKRETQSRKREGSVENIRVKYKNPIRIFSSPRVCQRNLE